MALENPGGDDVIATTVEIDRNRVLLTVWSGAPQADVTKNAASTETAPRNRKSLLRRGMSPSSLFGCGEPIPL
jgi:hypothetical protein